MVLKVLQYLYYAATVGSATMLGRNVLKNSSDFKGKKISEGVKTSFIGFISNFADTLGIGSFGIIVALLKLLKVDIQDKKIPGTLNVSCTLPILFEAMLFSTAVEVDPLTLVSLVIAAVIGSYIGAGIISKMDETKIQMVMGVSLFAAAIVMIITHPALGIFASSNEALGLTGTKLVIGIVGNFIFGALMTAGVGLYAPCMAMIFLLGMNVKAAFPIMMGSCALVLPISSMKFIKEESYDRFAALFISIAGIFGVLLAYYGFKNVDIESLKFIIIAVMIYTSITMLKSGISGMKEKKAAMLKGGSCVSTS